MNSSLKLSEQKTMIDFRPLKAWRYNPAKVEFQSVLAPPYDVISPAYQDKLYSYSPYNCVRLILNKETPQDSPESNRYTRARESFASWCREKILIQDEAPCFYLYRQTFLEPHSGQTQSRTAILGRLRLESFEKQGVVPHEKTLSKPKEDRRKLLEETHTNFSPVFGLYEDDAGVIQSKFRNVTSHAPLFDIKDEQGVQQTVWPVDDTELIEFFRQELSCKKIYIADGHHRYQTALDFSKKVRSEKKVSENTELDSDFVLMALVSFDDPGLVIYPTHRLITEFGSSKIDPTAENILTSLRDCFDFEKLSPDQLKIRLNQASGSEPVLGLLTLKDGYLLKVKNWDAVKQKMTAQKPEVWYRLDVNLITHLILKSLWAVPESEWESLIRYTHDWEEAVSSIKSQKAKTVFLLRAPKVQILRDMGNVRELMPQKSTYFYPKLASGIVFYHHQS